MRYHSSDPAGPLFNPGFRQMPCNMGKIEYTCKKNDAGMLPGSVQIFKEELTDENSNVHTAWFL